MRDELNNYGINNPDGTAEVKSDARKYDNDNPKSIKEDALSGQKESSYVSETYDDPKGATSEEKGEENLDIDLSSTSTSASTASSSAATASASVGGGLGALAGVVATSVMAAVIVAAVFISTLTIKLSLVMADMTSLVFEVEMTGAQEEDFENPIFAVLTGEDGVYQEREISPDLTTISFDGLEAGKEYLVTVKNAEKVFFENIFFTASTPNEKGSIVSHMEGTEVFVTVERVDLDRSECYTLVAKDAQGNIVYQRDGIETYTQYSFTVDQPQNLYFSLIVSGKTYAVSKIELPPPPEYDMANGVWTWSDDLVSATVSFADKNGGQPLVLTATVTKKTNKATCEEDGSVVYTAKVVYDDKIYTNKETTVLEAIGHSYEGVVEEGHITYTCSLCGDSYTDEN